MTSGQVSSGVVAIVMANSALTPSPAAKPKVVGPAHQQGDDGGDQGRGCGNSGDSQGVSGTVCPGQDQRIEHNDVAHGQESCQATTNLGAQR